MAKNLSAFDAQNLRKKAQEAPAVQNDKSGKPHVVTLPKNTAPSVLLANAGMTAANAVIAAISATERAKATATTALPRMAKAAGVNAAIAGRPSTTQRRQEKEQQAYQNYLNVQNQRLADLNAQIKEQNDIIAKKANDKIYELNKEIDKINATISFAQDNLIVTNAALKGDTDLFKQYRDAYYEANSGPIKAALRAMGGVTDNTDVHDAYVAMNEIKNQLLSKGYTEEDLQAYLNVANNKKYAPYIESLEIGRKKTRGTRYWRRWEA